MTIRLNFNQPYRPPKQEFKGSFESRRWHSGDLELVGKDAAAQVVRDYYFRKRPDRGYVEVSRSKSTTVYKVYMDGTCTCPDFQYRRMGNPDAVCKHVDAVMAVYGLTRLRFTLNTEVLKRKPMVRLQDLYND